MSTVPGNMLRAHVRAAIEEASGRALKVEDPTPDGLIATVGLMDSTNSELIEWIHETPKPEGWTPYAFAVWVRDRDRARGGIA